MPFILDGSSVYAKEGLYEENGLVYYEDAQGLVYGFYDDGKTCFLGGFMEITTENIVVPETITVKGVTYTVTTIISNALDDGFDDTLSIVKSIQLPDTLTTIEYAALNGLSSVEEIRIPKNVTDMDCWALPLTKFAVSEENATYSSDKQGWIYNKNKTILYRANQLTDGTATIPSTVEKIDMKAFSLTEFTKVVIPNSVKYIEESAFEQAAITGVEIPASVEYIGPFAFSMCSELTSVTLKEGIETIYAGAFAFNDNLKKIVIPASVRTIEGNPFSGCKKLTSVVVSKGNKNYCADESGNIYSKNKKTFVCANPVEKKITVPGSVKTIAEGAFSSCFVKEVIVKEGVEKIGYGCFAYCDNLVKITIAKSVDSIDDDVFNAVNENIKVYGYKNSYAEKYAKKYDIPFVSLDKSTAELPKVGSKKTLSSGQYKVTKSSSKSKEVTFVKPKSNNKTSITIPATVKINGYTYKVTEISSNALKNNEKIKSVTIGKNVKKIGKEAFCNCKKLNKITIKSSGLKSVGKNAIKNIDKRATIKVPAKQLSKYKKLFKSTTGYKKTMKIKK